MANEARWKNWTPWKGLIPSTPLPGDREAKGVKRDAQWKSQDSDLPLICRAGCWHEHSSCAHRVDLVKGYSSVQ